MSVEGIIQAFHQKPFRPFILKMENGTQYLVDQFEFICASRDYKTLYVSTDEDDRVDTVQTETVQSLDFVIL